MRKLLLSKKVMVAFVALTLFLIATNATNYRNGFRAITMLKERCEHKLKWRVNVLEFSNLKQHKSRFIKSHSVYSLDHKSEFNHISKIVFFATGDEINIIYDSLGSHYIIPEYSDAKNYKQINENINSKALNSIIQKERIVIDNGNINEYAREIFEIIYPERKTLLLSRKDVEQSLDEFDRDSFKKDEKKRNRFRTLLIRYADKAKIVEKNKHYGVEVFVWQEQQGVISKWNVNILKNGEITVNGLSVVEKYVGPYHVEMM